jgi:hypothetical protein
MCSRFTASRLVQSVVQRTIDTPKMSSQIEIVWVFNLPLMFDAIQNHALDGCPGIDKEGRFQRRRQDPKNGYVEES